MNIAQYISGVTTNITNQLKRNSISPKIIGNGFTDLADIISANTITVNNGLTIDENNLIQLGGVIIQDTNFNLDVGAQPIFNIIAKDNNSGINNGVNINFNTITLFRTRGIFFSEIQLNNAILLMAGNVNFDKTVKILINPNLGVQISDTANNVGLLYENNYSTAGLSNDRWIPDYGTIKSLVPITLAFYNSNGNQETSNINMINTTGTTNFDMFRLNVSGQLGLNEGSATAVLTYTDLNNNTQIVDLLTISDTGTTTDSNYLNFNPLPQNTISVDVNFTDNSSANGYYYVSAALEILPTITS